MRILYLLRHAKSSWNDPSLRDFDRPLKKRGREAAERVGKRMAAEKLNNLAVICSPAVRTRETAEIVLEHANLQVEPHFDERIYEASLRELVEVVSEIPSDAEVAIMIGHNPGFEELLAFLSGEHRRMPTCALAKIKFGDVSWKDVRAGEGRLEWFIAPKELPED
ncbi:MAG TPA: histidine phosphatase family protein [Pyrinomonadaceae bacterium]|jgi:phosphohistidine phosphatase|nr:histidine phosphatase family protein [Pyrinomonadaceae bacterium]